MSKSALDFLSSSLSRKRGKRTAFDALGKAFKSRGQHLCNDAQGARVRTGERNE